MKALQRWMTQGETLPVCRQVKIWWHYRYETPQLEAWWHVELHEFNPIADHGQRKQAGGWSQTEHVYVGYDKDLNVAARKALKRAKEAEAGR